MAFTFSSEASVKALRKGYSSKGFFLVILTRILFHLLHYAIVPVFVFAQRVHNHVADELSNNPFSSSCLGFFLRR